MKPRPRLLSLSTRTLEADSVAPSAITVGRALFTALGFAWLGLGLALCNDAPTLALLLGLSGLVAFSLGQVPREHSLDVRDRASLTRAMRAAAVVSVRPDP